MKKQLSVLSVIAMCSLLALCSCSLINVDKEHTHVFGEWNTLQDANCETEGTKERTCKCGEVEEATIPAYGHTLKNGVCEKCQYETPSPAELFIFTELDDGTYSISAENHYTISGKIIIPHEYNGKAVTQIASAAFNSCSEITEIVIPDSITYIGSVAFLGCSSIKSFVIPKGIKELETAIFAECRNLETVELPDGITRIGHSAFLECSNLIQIDIPKTVTKIEGSAFKGCRSLKSITIPEGVEHIDAYAFADCYSISEIVLPSSIVTIQEYAFSECYTLTSIHLHSGIKRIARGAFNGCEMIQDIYFDANAEAWNNITIDEKNNSLTNGTIHYSND